ncbi:MAG: hypothetical protein HYY06_08340 [Deltaproteobacteria bacterium]|nr:hypothetical protein [Deltaproteobacteria bacterium]
MPRSPASRKIAPPPEDPVAKALAEAPEDDEPVTPEERAALEESRSGRQRAKALTTEQLRRKLGL